MKQAREKQFLYKHRIVPLWLYGVCLMLCSVFYAQAQAQGVSGTITDVNGEPVVGASVVVKGSTYGVVTGSDGQYIINAKQGSTLSFSSVGYAAQEVTVNNNVMDITLQEDAQNIDDVVVVGYGSMRKRDVSASISAVKGKDLAASSTLTFDQALSGKVAGVLIRTQSGLLGEGTNIRIRGTNSISNSNQPLIVVDGVPLDGTTNTSVFNSGNGTRNNPLSTINMNDVESYEVLKDAAAAALYGSRAANGVILITTKRGREGTVNVSYNGNVGWVRAARVPKLLNAQQFVDITNEKAVNRFGDGTIVSQLVDLNGDGELDKTNWMNEIFRTGFQQSHQLSFNAGTSKASLYGSGEYADQQGIAIGNRLTRYSARLNGDVQPTTWLKVGISSNFSQVKNSGVLSDGYLAGLAVAGYNAPPNISPFNPDKSYNVVSGLLGGYYTGATLPANQPLLTNKTGTGNLFLNNFYNPIASIALQRNNNTLSRFLGNAYANITPVKGLILTTKIGVDLWKNFEDQYSHPKIAGLGLSNTGYVQTNQATNLLWNWSNYANYNLTIHEHNLSVLAGLEYQVNSYQDIYTGAKTFSDTQFQDILDGTYTGHNTGGTKNANGFSSYFGRLGYNYAQKYYIDMSFRADSYSGFGENNQTGYFPGISAAWRISQESFMNSMSSVLDDLKLRASWGLVGNSSVGSYASRTLYGGGQYADLNGNSISQVGNPDLKWETSMKIDIGIDVTLWKGRVNLIFDYWRNDISNMLLKAPVPYTSGLPGGTVTTNIGKMYNQGIEISLNTINLEINDFKWISNFNFTTVNNKVQTLSTSGDVIGTWARASEGKPLGTYYLIEWVEVNPDNGFNGWYDKDGVVKYYNPATKKYCLKDGTPTTDITANDEKYLEGKTGSPTWYGNFDNTFSYKGIDLTIGLQFSGGFWVYNATRQGLLTNYINNNLAEITNRWQKPGDVTDIPKLYIADGSIINRRSSQFLEKGDFLRLRDITIGYTLSPEYLKKTGKLGLKSMRIYFRASNVALLTKYKGVDPELSTTANAVLSMGVDNRSIPLPSSYNIGINIYF